MIPYKNEKIQNAIAFFAKEHCKKVRKPLYQTYLYKYLAFLDFISLREVGRPALELIYKAMERMRLILCIGLLKYTQQNG
jgi:hypothetical protein